MGLLLLRGFVGVTLIADAATYAPAGKTVLSWIIAGLGLASGGCLLLGLVTPVVAIAVTLGAAALTFSGLLPSMEIVVLGIAIALLGPGAFSLDARMFGRREILVSQTPRSPKC